MSSASYIPISDEGDASFSISGKASVGNILSVTEKVKDPDGTGKLSYKWQTSSDGNSWTDVGNKPSYNIRYDDSHKFIKSIILFVNNDQNEISDPGFP